MLVLGNQEKVKKVNLLYLKVVRWEVRLKLEFQLLLRSGYCMAPSGLGIPSFCWKPSPNRIGARKSRKFFKKVSPLLFLLVGWEVRLKFEFQLLLRTGYCMPPSGLGIPIFGWKPSHNRVGAIQSRKSLKSYPNVFKASEVTKSGKNKITDAFCNFKILWQKPKIIFQLARSIY